MKKLILLVFCFGLFACSPICELAKSIVVPFANTVVSQCGCKNASQVQADFISVLNTVKICSATGNQGTIANIVCPIAGNIGTSLIADKLFSPSWQCTNAAGCVGTVMALAVAACEQIPL